MFLEGFLEITWVAHAFQGIKIAVGILILDAALKMIKKMQKKPLQTGILTAAFAVLMFVNILKMHLSSIVIMLASAFVSLAFFQIDKFRRRDRDDLS
jgi:chromate transporter